MYTTPCLLASSELKDDCLNDIFNNFSQKFNNEDRQTYPRYSFCILVQKEFVSLCVSRFILGFFKATLNRALLADYPNC